MKVTATRIVTDPFFYFDPWGMYPLIRQHEEMVREYDETHDSELLDDIIALEYSIGWRDDEGFVIEIGQCDPVE